MNPCDPMAVAVDWLDAYRDASLDQIVAMYSPDGVIECACGGQKIIQGAEGISAYWRHRFVQIPALELEQLQMDGGAVVVSYRTSSGAVQAFLDIGDDGLITCCRCGPVTRDFANVSRGVANMQDTLAQLEKLRSNAAECELIRDLATDPKKRNLFDRLAAHLSVLACEVEREMLKSGQKD
jgi:hypothetical protein